MSGIVRVRDMKKGGNPFSQIGKSSLANGFIIVAIILLVIGLYLLSQDNTESGYPILITGVLGGALGRYLLYKSKKSQPKAEEAESEAEEFEE